MAIKSYRQAGVDIEAGEALVDFIKSIDSPAVPEGLGGFAGGIPLDPTRYRRPVLMSTSDGVGTKLLVAKRLGRYDTVGIDLVAMCANDLMVCGAKPLAFQDYIACGRIIPDRLREVIRGIVRGCEMADCLLTGGETAELPDMYDEQDLDLAGFCLGIVEADRQLPKMHSIGAGDAILGLPSNGIHSNGFALARKVLDPEDGWEDLLVPTRIYRSELHILIGGGLVSAAAHITGGGLQSNIDRVLPERYRAHLTYDWKRPAIFDRIRKAGDIEEAEMRKVFNLGIGVAAIVKPDVKDRLLRLALENSIEIITIGAVEER